MEKEQYRSVIRFLFLDGKTCDTIKVKLDAVYGDQSPSMTTVRYWFNEFKRGRTTVFDEDRAGRPSDVVTEEVIGKVQDIIVANCNTKVREVAEAVGVSYGTAIKILNDKIGVKKVSARWVPRSLTPDGELSAPKKTKIESKKKPEPEPKKKKKSGRKFKDASKSNVPTQGCKLSPTL